MDQAALILLRMGGGEKRAIGRHKHGLEGRGGRVHAANLLAEDGPTANQRQMRALTGPASKHPIAWLELILVCVAGRAHYDTAGRIS